MSPQRPKELIQKTDFFPREWYFMDEGHNRESREWLISFNDNRFKKLEGS